MIKNVLVYLMSTPAPSHGGVSKMACSIGDILQRNGFAVYYIAYQNLESRLPKSVDGVFYFPSQNYDGKDNRKYLCHILDSKKINYVINHIPLNEQFCDILYDECNNRNIEVFSVIHNASLNIISGYAYRVEYQLKKNGLSFIFNILKSKLFRRLIEYIYIKKHRKHFQKIERNSANTILVSESNRHDFNRILGYESTKLISISNCIVKDGSEETYADVVEKKANVVVWCGRVETYRKRTDLMLDIWSKVSIQNQNWELYVLGGGNVEEMKSYAHKLGLKNVFFTNNTDPRPYYERAKIFCHTSVSESFGLVIVEAMSYGVVPIAFDIWPASKDVIKNDSGITVSNVDTDVFAQKLLSLMTDSDKLTYYSKNAYYFSKEFEAEKIESRWIKLMNKTNQSKTKQNKTRL